MKNIAGLLQELKYTVIDGKPEGEISELVYDSRKVTKDCMFVCIKGATYDAMTIQRRSPGQAQK